MFYSEYILSKRGPLGQVWLAAHWDHRKLNKAEINRADIRECVNTVITPPAPLALRLQAQLLLGVARIYSRKAKYLLDDCNDALAKVKLAFHTGALDLAADQAVASYGAITLGDALFDLDSIAPLTDSMGADYASLDSALNLTQHQSTSDHLINMRPRMSTSTLQRQIDADDNFGAGLADEVTGNTSIEVGRAGTDTRPAFNDSLNKARGSLDGSIERGRDAGAERPLFNDTLTGDNLELSKAGPIGPAAVTADTFGDEIGLDNYQQYEGGGGYDIEPYDMPPIMDGVEGAPAAGDAGKPTAPIDEMELPTATAAGASAAPATPAKAAAAAAAAPTRKRRLAIVDEQPSLAKALYKRWLTDASELLRPSASLARLNADPLADLLMIQNDDVPAPPHDFLEHPALPGLPVELRSLIVGYRQTVPVRTEAATPVKRRAVDNAANAEAASIRKRPASPTQVDDAPAAKSPKTDGAADAPAPGDDALVPGDNYQYDDYAGGGGYDDVVGLQVVEPIDTGAKDASPAKARGTDGAKTKDTGKDEDEDRPDEPENEEDLQDIEAGRLSKRTQETAALLARNLEGSRRANVSAQTLLKGKSSAAAATFFYDLLVLKTGAFIDVKQDKPFADIAISATDLLPKALAVA